MKWDRKNNQSREKEGGKEKCNWKSRKRTLKDAMVFGYSFDSFSGGFRFQISLLLKAFFSNKRWSSRGRFSGFDVKPTKSRYSRRLRGTKQGTVGSVTSSHLHAAILSNYGRSKITSHQLFLQNSANFCVGILKLLLVGKLATSLGLMQRLFW